MKPVERNEIIDYVTYEEQRDAVRYEAMGAKALRRVHIGEYLTLLFENHLTMKYQIQEMVRAVLKLKEIPRPDDAADALAAAITHSMTMR